jgi:uncharacterized protein (DUF39 family)
VSIFLNRPEYIVLSSGFQASNLIETLSGISEVKEADKTYIAFNFITNYMELSPS